MKVKGTYMINILKSLFLSLAISTLIYGGSVMAEERDIIHMTLKDGVVKMETRPDLAPKHVAQIKQLISEGQYDGVVFHSCLLYTSPSPRDAHESRMPSSA